MYYVPLITIVLKIGLSNDKRTVVYIFTIITVGTLVSYVTCTVVGTR